MTLVWNSRASRRRRACANAGHVAGIRGYVDRNAFNGSIKDWQAWLADTKPPGAHGA
jgi:hypothetical protein